MALSIILLDPVRVKWEIKKTITGFVSSGSLASFGVSSVVSCYIQ